MIRYELIQEMREEHSFSVTDLCASFDVSRSGYYAWGSRAPSEREQRNQAALEVIEEIHQHRHTKCYGSPRMTPELHEHGFIFSENRVARLMRSEGIQARRKRAFRPKTTIQDDASTSRIAPNRLADLEGADAPGQALVADITYVATREGWLYLAVVMDLFSRSILGWKISENLATPLVTSALLKALRSRWVSGGALFHSDRGCQYTSKEFARMLESNDLTPSMSAKGYCYDNAACESFFATLKCEAFPANQVFDSKTEARMAIFDYLETFYNRRRRHSSLGHMSPQQFLDQYLQKSTLSLN
jgi:transposase InsO family protein